MTEIAPGALDLATLEKIFREQTPVTLDRAAKPQVDAASALVARASAADIPVYGVNTGFGKLSQTRIAPGDTATLQRNLILSHCCGVGTPLSIAETRLMMVLKLNSLGRGASGVRWELLELMEGMLAQGVTPVIPGQGSVGASGDLAPLAHMTAVLIGEGEAWFNAERLTGGEALAKAGLTPIALGPKEGLGFINGTQFSAALALAHLFNTQRIWRAALVTGALSTDAAMGSAAPFRPEIHALRGQPGQIEAAAILYALMDGSEIRESHREDDERVQDPYCIRCQPQVMGCRIHIASAASRKSWAPASTC